ncbi:hypothetical protein MIR68_004471 [Amoeboaphelidium protococcarum]|nr:hypothetical protein MIR68_004471 [Amoeboaphelidium protococcarum]
MLGINLLRHSVNALKDPTRQDLVAAVSELFVAEPSLQRLRQRMLSTPTGRQILRDRPMISSQSIDLERLRQLDENTFGKQYTLFLDKEQVSPDTREAVKLLPTKDPELAYILLRYRQIHDFMHTLLGVPTTLKGELALKWFEFVQTGLPMTAIAGIFGSARLLPLWRFQDLESAGNFQAQPVSRYAESDIQQFVNVYVPWAIKSGARADLLLSVYWEKCFNMDLDDLRRAHRITPMSKAQQAKHNNIINKQM